jgi:MFS family permease
VSLGKIKGSIYYGWVIVGALFVIQALFFGIRTSFGIFLTSIETEFALSRATTSAINSVSWLLLCISSVLGGWAFDRYGPKIVFLLMGLITGLSLILTSQTNALWQLFITYGLLLAIGSGAIYVVTMPTISRWFDKKRALAIGIASSGGGLGTAAIAPFAAYLIANFSWRVAYIVLGLMALAIVIPSSFILKNDPKELGMLPDGAKLIQDTPDSQQAKTKLSGLTLKQASRTRGFWLMAFVWLLHSFCMLLILTHVVAHATDMSISTGSASAIISFIGLTRALGLIIMGGVADRIGRKKVAIIGTTLMTTSVVLLTFSRELWMLYLFAAIYGFGEGGQLSSITALMADYFGLLNFGSILGVLDIGWAIGSAIGPLVGGLIYDINGSYFSAFLLGSIAMALVVLLISFFRSSAHSPATN